MTETTIATSIAPRDFDLQRAAIDSWLRLGFRVVSLNSAEEAEIIRRECPGISVKVANRTAEAMTGKQYVFLDDIFAVLLDEGTDICGIVNSDIHLFAADDIRDFIGRHTSGGLIFGARQDVDSLGDLVGEEYGGGFDFFFFERSLISLYPKTDFCLGAPWWDFWMPLVPVLRGVPVRQFVSPFAYHRNHPTKWAQDVFDDFARMFAEYLLQKELRENLDEKLRHLAERSRTHKESRGPLSIITLYYLKLITEKISYIFPGDSENKSVRTVKEQTEESERMLFYQAQFTQMFKLLNEQEEILLRCRHNLHELKSSWSWRLTAPLRLIAGNRRSEKQD